jgi:hypothetical protein
MLSKEKDYDMELDLKVQASGKEPVNIRLVLFQLRSINQPINQTSINLLEPN